MTDDGLRHRRDALNFILEQNWGLIGWELQHAKDLSDIRSAFCLITEHHHPLLDMLRHEPTMDATPNTLRALRKELTRVESESRRLYQALEHEKRYAEYALTTATHSKDSVARSEVQSLLPTFEARHVSAEEDFEANRKRLIELDSQLVAMEACFAQSQLLEFIQSGRRKFTPLNLTMALAGIPYLTARVSCERCSPLEPAIYPGFTYLMFCAIKDVFSTSAGEMRPGLEQMRSYLLDKRRKILPHIIELKKNWYFLECAIESVGKRSEISRSALPYRIFAEYQRRFGCQSQADMLLAGEHPL